MTNTALDAFWMDLISDLRKPGPTRFFASATLQKQYRSIEADLRKRYPSFDDHCKAQEQTP